MGDILKQTPNPEPPSGWATERLAQKPRHLGEGPLSRPELLELPPALRQLPAPCPEPVATLPLTARPLWGAASCSPEMRVWIVNEC